MPVNNVTANQSYQLPDPTNQLDYDVGRIISAINGIDTNVATLFASLSGKAATAHTHAIADVTNLQAALDSKIGTGTNLPISQVTNLQASLDGKASLSGAAFVGTVTGVTPSTGANNTQFATTAWVRLQGYLTAVVTANIGDLQVTAPKLATDAVETSKVKDANITFAKLASAALATAAEFLSKSASKVLTAVAVWDAAVPVIIPFAATQNLDFSTFINGRIAATANTTWGATAGLVRGQMGIIEFKHDDGVRTLAYDTLYFKAAPGFALSTTIWAVDYISYYVCDDGKVLLSVIKNPT